LQGVHGSATDEEFARPQGQTNELPTAVDFYEANGPHRMDWRMLKKRKHDYRLWTV